MNMQQDPIPQLPYEVIAALDKGRKIEAIKLLRSAKDLDLKEAKEEVERYLERAQAHNPIREEPPSRHTLALVIGLLILAAAGYFVFGRI